MNPNSMKQRKQKPNHLRKKQSRHIQHIQQAENILWNAIQEKRNHPLSAQEGIKNLMHQAHLNVKKLEELFNGILSNHPNAATPPIRIRELLIPLTTAAPNPSLEISKMIQRKKSSFHQISQIFNGKIMD